MEIDCIFRNFRENFIFAKVLKDIFAPLKFMTRYISKPQSDRAYRICANAKFCKNKNLAKISEITVFGFAAPKNNTDFC